MIAAVTDKNMRNKISITDFEAFFRRLASGITQNPDSLGIESELVNGVISLQFQPATKHDTSVLIGSKGVMHQSIRTVLTVLAARFGYKLHLAPVLEASGTESGTCRPMTLEQIGDVFSETCAALFSEPYGWAWDRSTQRTNINLMISKTEERAVTDAELGEALSRIFNAIGKCNGVNIYVTLERSKK